MSFIEMSNEELEAVRRHHDMLIQMGELELRADQIRASGPANTRQQLLQPIESKLHQLGDAVAHLSV